VTWPPQFSGDGSGRKTICNSVAFRVEALNYAMQFAREMNMELADTFIGM